MNPRPGTTVQTDLGLQPCLDDYWTHRAGAYDAGQRRPERWDEDRAMWSRIWSEALPQPPAQVLDLGTGTGHAALLIAELGHDVIGLDASAGMLAVAEEHAREARAAGRPTPTFVLGDAVDPDVRAESLDAVTSRYLAWTLRDPVGAMTRWREALRPGGVLALVDSTWFTDGLDESPPEFVASYGAVLDDLPLARATSIEPTVEAVRAAGFREVAVRELTEVLAADERYGAAPGHRPRLQHLVTARR